MDRVRDAVPEEVKMTTRSSQKIVVGESTEQTSTVQRKQKPQPVGSLCASSSAVYHGRGTHFTGCKVMGVAPLA